MKSSEQIDKLLAEQSAEWTEALERGDERDMAAFAQWSLKSPQHMRHFLMMMALDRELKNIDPARRLEIPAGSGEIAPIIALHEEPAKAVVAIPPRARSARRRWAIAAAIGGGIALLVMLQFASGRFGGWQEFATVQGEQRAVELSDGSIMHLNTQSNAKVRFSQEERDIRLLEGEALFKVAKDAARPFRVHTSDLVIQAVGTQFNVYAHRDGTKVSVLEGRVRILPDRLLTAAPAEPPASLTAGQEAKVEHGRIETRAAPDVAALGAWRQRRLVFNQEPLSNVVAEFNRYNRALKLRVVDADVGLRPYSGAFDADDPQSLMQLLGANSELELVSSGTEILIRRRAP